MTSNKKKHVNDEEAMQETDSEVSGEEESDEEEQISPGDEVKLAQFHNSQKFSKFHHNFQEVQVDFEGRNPIDSDFDGIQQLLRQLFLKSHINLTDFANTIISQNYIGSVIKQCWDEEMTDDEDDDPNVVFGVTTVINLTSRKESEFVKNVKSMILDRAEKLSTDATLKLLRDILTNDERTTGFLINERYINIPPQISVPMLENLCKEIKRANEKKMPYNFAYYVMILKFHRKEAKKGKQAEDFFSNPEEELFSRESLASFEYSVKDECDTGLSGKWREDDEELTPFRKVIVIDGKKLPEIVEQVNGFIHGS